MSPIAARCTGNSLRRPELRIVGKAGDRLIERGVQVHENPRAGRAVVPPLPQRLEQGIARQLRHEIAGEAADRAEARRARTGRAGPALVVVAVTDHADAESLLEGIVQQPFERAPGRMHLDGALQPAVMGIFQVGVAAADMGDDDGVLAFERAEQFVGGVDRIRRGLPLHQDVRRAPDRPALAAIEDVAIAAHAGVARPFVAGQADEPAGRVERGRQPVEFVPERVGDLEVVALVADHVDEGRVARVAEIGLGRSHPDGFAALPVQVAPIAAQRVPASPRAADWRARPPCRQPSGAARYRLRHRRSDSR